MKKLATKTARETLAMAIELYKETKAEDMNVSTNVKDGFHLSIYICEAKDKNQINLDVTE